MLSPGNTGALSELTAQWERQGINQWQYNLNIILVDCTKGMGSLRTSTAWEAEAAVQAAGPPSVKMGLQREEERRGAWQVSTLGASSSSMCWERDVKWQETTEEVEAAMQTDISSKHTVHRQGEASGVWAGERHDPTTAVRKISGSGKKCTSTSETGGGSPVSKPFS